MEDDDSVNDELHHRHPYHWPEPRPEPQPERAVALTSVQQARLTEALRLEVVTTCVGFDDFLDETLAYNHGQVDTMIVVTTHQDWKTQGVARKHGALCVQTDLFFKNGRQFNKGAAINSGFDYFQYHGWRMHLDCDIALPANFRRMLFNHTHLDQSCLYGADRFDVIGSQSLGKVGIQHSHGLFVNAPTAASMSHRMIRTLNGYEPLGYFQLWHASCQKAYPYSGRRLMMTPCLRISGQSHRGGCCLPFWFITC
jgi:hypothetical protein